MKAHDKIEAVMKTAQIREAVHRLELALQGLSLTPQQQLAAVALLAAKQISVLPPEAHVDAGEMLGNLVSIGLNL